MPSALSVSKAYSISLRLPCASGGAMTANRPKRPGWSRTILAPYSLSWRARPRASSTLFPYQTPGWAIERIAVAMPLLSISSSEAAGDHFGGGAPLRVRGRRAPDYRDRPRAQRGHAAGQELSPRGVRARRLAAQASAEKLECGIGAHPFLAILLWCELSVGSSRVPGSNSARQPISGRAGDLQRRDRDFRRRAIRGRR